MPHQTEPSANNALGNILQGMLGKATVLSENTQVIEGHAGYHPDILVTNPGRSPVVIEAEYDPAQNVEPEARDRLNLKVVGQSAAHRGRHRPSLSRGRRRGPRPFRRRPGRDPALLRFYRRRRQNRPLPRVRLARRLGAGPCGSGPLGIRPAERRRSGRYFPPAGH